MDAADLAVDLQRLGLHQVDLGRHLPVPELARVEVVLVAGQVRCPVPAEEDVARRLGQALALDDPAPVVLVRALAHVRLQHRRLGLLDLEEQRVAVVATADVRDPAPGADAPDAHHLPRHVHQLVGLEQVAPVGLEALAVAAEPLVQDRPGLVGDVGREEILELHDQRRVAHDAAPAVDDLVSFDRAPEAVLAARLGQVLLEPPRRLLVDPCRPRPRRRSLSSSRGYQRLRSPRAALSVIASR